MKFLLYIYKHHINILHKYLWNHNLDNNVMNLYLTVCRFVRNMLIFCNKTHLVQILVCMQVNFAVVFHTIYYLLNKGLLKVYC